MFNVCMLNVRDLDGVKSQPMKIILSLCARMHEHFASHNHFLARRKLFLNIENPLSNNISFSLWFWEPNGKMDVDTHHHQSSSLSLSSSVAAIIHPSRRLAIQQSRTSTSWSMLRVLHLLPKTSSVGSTPMLKLSLDAKVHKFQSRGTRTPLPLDDESAERDPCYRFFVPSLYLVRFGEPKLGHFRLQFQERVGTKSRRQMMVG